MVPGVQPHVRRRQTLRSLPAKAGGVNPFAGPVFPTHDPAGPLREKRSPPPESEQGFF